jgi:hypothetical protein
LLIKIILIFRAVNYKRSRIPKRDSASMAARVLQQCKSQGDLRSRIQTFVGCEAVVDPAAANRFNGRLGQPLTGFNRPARCLMILPPGG